MEIPTMRNMIHLLFAFTLSTALYGQGIGTFTSEPLWKQTAIGSAAVPASEEIAQNEEPAATSVIPNEEPVLKNAIPTEKATAKKVKSNPLRNPEQREFKPTAAPKPCAIKPAPVPTPVCAVECYEPVCDEPCECPPPPRTKSSFWAPVAIVAGGVAAACVAATPGSCSEQ